MHDQRWIKQMISKTLLVFLLIGRVSAYGLSDDPVRGCSQDSFPITSWVASSTVAGISSMPSSVPGDIVTDLEASAGYGDPLFGLNWLNSTYDGPDWTQTATFDTPAQLMSAPDVLLVFDSIKMAATVTLNGVDLGVAADQFLRYNFSVGSLLLPVGAGSNNLTLSYFASADAANVEGRYMACSGGWDWAPYSATETAAGGHTFSKGVVKDAYLVPTCGVSLAHVVPLVTYQGGFPTEPLEDGQAKPFSVSVDVVLWVPSKASTGAVVTVVAEWALGPTNGSQVVLGALPQGETVVRLKLPDAEGVDLWWPLGMQTKKGGSSASSTTYQINVTVTPAPADSGGSGGVASFATRSVGFRVAHLVTTNIGDASANVLADTRTSTPTTSTSTGSGDHTMRFKVNGADVWARGSNVIPMEELEGRESSAAYVALVNHAADANHNMLRVWGGGKFLPESFYEACDRLGVMLWQDAMYGRPWFGGNGSVPLADSPMQVAEVTHNVRRLSAHPSILLWCAGNEYDGMYVNALEQFLFPTIYSVDPTRALWPSSPSGGFLSGVNTWTGLPDGEPFKLLNSGGAVYREVKNAFKAEAEAEAEAGRSGSGIQGAGASCLSVSGVTYEHGMKSHDDANDDEEDGKGLAAEFETRRSVRKRAESVEECCALCHLQILATGPAAAAAAAAASPGDNDSGAHISHRGGGGGCHVVVFDRSDKSCTFKPSDLGSGGGSGEGGKGVLAASTADVVSVFPSIESRQRVLPALPAHVIETHGPYQHGSGFQTVDDAEGFLVLFPPNVPPVLYHNDATASDLKAPLIGARFPGTFSSEFGASVFSSFESLSPTLSPQDWSLHSEAMRERNYPGDNFVEVYFGPAARETLDGAPSELNLKRGLWLQMAGQYLQQKGDLERRRSGNTWGLLTWQLNEIWPTGGWGSLEYGTVGFTSGQVLGGRWKPLHHLMETHLFRDTVLLCGVSSYEADAFDSADARCLLRHDGALAGFNGSWSVQLLRLTDGVTVGLGSGSVALPRGAGSTEWVCVGQGGGAMSTSTSAVNVAGQAVATREDGQDVKRGVRGRGATRKRRQHQRGDGDGDNSSSSSSSSFTPVAAATLLLPVCNASWSEVLGSAGCATNGSDCVLVASMSDSAGVLVDYHVDLLAPPFELALPAATVTAQVGTALNADGSVDVSVSVVVNEGGGGGGGGSDLKREGDGEGEGDGGGGGDSKGGAVALMVTLTALEQGVFGDNVFALTSAQSPKVVKFRPIVGAAGIDPAGLAASLRVEHLATYMAAAHE